MRLIEAVNTYGLPAGPSYPDCLDKGKVCLGGGFNGDWAGSAEKAFEVASILKKSGLNTGSQKRTRELTASGRRSDHWDGSKDSYGIDYPARGEKGDTAWKNLRDEFVSRGWITKEQMPDSLLEKNKGKWVNFSVGDYRYQVGWNVGGHYDHIHVGVRNKNPKETGSSTQTTTPQTTTPQKDIVTIEKVPVILMGGLNYRDGDKTTQEQGNLVSSGLGDDTKVIAKDYNDLAGVKQEIDKNPNSPIVLFSAGGGYASQITKYIKEKGGDPANIFISEPYTCSSNTKTNVEDAIANGVQVGNIIHGGTDCTGSNIAAGVSRKEKGGKSHWDGLKVAGELVKERLGKLINKKGDDEVKQTIPKQTTSTETPKISDKEAESRIFNIFGKNLKESKKLNEEVNRINDLIKKVL